MKNIHFNFLVDYLLCVAHKHKLFIIHDKKKGIRMNITAIAIVAIVCGSIVALVNGAKDKKKDKKYMEKSNLTNELEREVIALRERVETLERIVTDEKYDLHRQFDDLKKDKVA